MIHIEHVVLSLEPGGLENGVVNVVNNLDPARFRSSICCLKSKGEFAKRIEAQRTPITEMNWTGGQSVGLLLRLSHNFRQRRPDIVHTRNFAALYYGLLAARLSGVRTVVHSEHGRIFDDSFLRQKLQKLMFGNAQGLFAVSQQLRSELVEKLQVPEESVQVLYNGVALHKVEQGARIRIRENLGVSNSTFLVGSVGRLVPVKNYPLLLRAMSSNNLRVASLLLVGEGPERNSLESLSKSLGIESRVHFVGHQDNVSDWLSAMDCFVLPSLSEGMSNTLLEAMSCKIPVVASDVGGNGEIIANGVDGLLFPSGSVAELSGQLEYLYSNANVRNRLAENAQRKALTDFSMTAMISRYESFYETARVQRKW